jgi:hypothetical protein
MQEAPLELSLESTNHLREATQHDSEPARQNNKPRDLGLERIAIANHMGLS